jgi:predicted Ser/Thr protein kinase
MNAERWTRLQQIFEGALAQPVEGRRDWVRRACGSDGELLREAEALLDAHESPDHGFLEQPARLDPSDLDSLPEGTELGSYRIVREIGRGGMGVVYLAHDNLGRSVAIKTLPPILAADTGLRERLAREARAAATITHPGVATVYRFDEIDGHLVIVSEYVPGETLRSLVGEGPVDPARAHSFATQIGEALAAAHDAGVIHRDLKPENIVVTPGGRVKVVDFGIARIERLEGSGPQANSTVFGTPGYMAPEQQEGGPVTSRTDIYAFGVVFAEMLTGHGPLSGRRAPIPPRFEAVIARCVNADPAARYASARDLLAALAAAAPVPQAPIARQPGSPRWWWEFHQAVAAAVYWLMLWPAWNARGIVGGRVGGGLFLATLVAVIIAALLRLHLWFTSRFYPSELRWARRRAGRWIRAADWMFVSSLAAAGILIGGDRPVAIVLVAVAVGATIAFLVIERATTRAAFRSSAAAGRDP